MIRHFISVAALLFLACATTAEAQRSRTRAAATPAAASTVTLTLPDVRTNPPVLRRDNQNIPARPELLEAQPFYFAVPDVARTTLTNELKVFAYEAREIPSVDFVLLIRAGSLCDPAGKTGLADLTARALRAAGTRTRTPEQVDLDLDRSGSSIEITAERDFVRVRAFALAAEAENTLRLVADLIRNPAFDATRLAQQRDLLAGELRLRDDDPADTARREYRKIIYGADHPLARTPEIDGVVRLIRDDVVTFHSVHYQPSQVWLGIAGDIGTTEAQNLALAVFGDWATGVPVPPVAKEIDSARDSAPGTFLIPKNLEQAHIRIGHLGAPRSADDEPALTVLNSIFGTAGFTSRLTMVVRTKLGLAYSVGGGVFSDDPAGLFVGVASTRVDATTQAIAAMQEVIGGMITSPPAPEELEIARRDASFSFANGFSTPRDVVYQYLYHDILGYPADYLKQYLSRVQAVTADNVTSAAAAAIHPGRLKVVVHGPAQLEQQALESLGPVQVVPLRIP